jgi:diketogulonate reductase-like aldo/keto reductase
MIRPDLEDVPPIGLGTWKNDDPRECAQSVRQALEIGYRHVDTAQLYENESAVGNGIAESSVDREEVFLATKLHFDHLDPRHVRETTLESLEDLRTDYVDLLYVHWPAGNYEAERTLPAMEELVDEEGVRSIGLSNFTPDLLEEARSVLEAPIYAHQIEMHPFLQQEHLLADARNHEGRIVAYSPFRHGTLFDEFILKEIAEEHGISVAQVCLAWLIQKDDVFTIPKASSRNHLEDNFEACSVTLDEESVQRINTVNTLDRFIDPPFAPDWEL